ncbi:hypothetical protein F5Y16DRAFT_105497 [Xylariaceae sp. FL0255]|nr:hypothetical protein F5Y16DRAFT_105497 [Xylariaceae sp. FL0255]
MSNVDVVQQRTAAAPLPSQLGSAVAVSAVAAAAKAAKLTMPPNTTSSTAAALPTATTPLAAAIAKTAATLIPALTTTTITTARSTPTPPIPALSTGMLTLNSQIGSTGSSSGTKRTRSTDHSRDGRITKSRQRPVFSKSMDPPVLSFYGTQPVPLPSRFASLKRRLIAGHEAAIEASWARLIEALRTEIQHIDQHRTELIPSIDFCDINDPTKVKPFDAQLKRHGIGVIRGVVPQAEASRWVEETKKYFEKGHECKPPPAQDPTCFEFFWTPAQVRSRAHPHMLQAQRFAMSLWNLNGDDRLATRFPISYADRIRIESSSNGVTTINGVASSAPTSAEDSLIAAAAAAYDKTIAQVDNGSLERWEQDGYGRCGLYDDIFKGNWEAYNAWDPAGRINATSDLYNGAGACSMMRLFQGILALTTVEPGMISLLPSPKLSTVYFLLRPFFSPKEGPPDSNDSIEKWEKYLDPSNWTLDKEQSTIIHGAVPGHAQRVTTAWHPHLELHKSLVTPPTLQVGDYIVWHPDQAYQFSNHYTRNNTKPDSGFSDPHTLMLVYSPAAPLTQTNALFLARQRKAFLRGHPGPDFDSTGTGLGSEAPHTGRLGEKEIREVGGEEGLRAMGLAPWVLDKSNAHKAVTTIDSTSAKKPSEERKEDEASSGSSSPSTPSTQGSRAEAEVVRLANIILFPDRYDFYMPTRASSPVPGTSREREKEKEPEMAAETKGEALSTKAQ